MSKPTINCCRTQSYNCFNCKISFKTTSELINHVHQKHIVYECLCCEYSTVKYSSLAMHCRDKHNKYDLIHCPNCHFIGSDLNSLDQHFMGSHVYPSHTYYCPTCGYSTIFENEMRKHICGNHKGILTFCPCSVAPLSNCVKNFNVFTYNCSFCSYKTNKRPALTNHFMDTHWPGYDSPDENSDDDDDDDDDDGSPGPSGYYYTYSNGNSYDSHDDEQYSCFICGEELCNFDKQEMMHHLNRHQTSIVCLFCKKLQNA